MKKPLLTMLLFAGFLACTAGHSNSEANTNSTDSTVDSDLIQLSNPSMISYSLQEAIQQRRTERTFNPQSQLSMQTVSDILYWGDGLTQDRFRAAPSAGALYPVQIYVIAYRIEDLEPGVYHYSPDKHSLTTIQLGDMQDPIIEAAWGQTWLSHCSMVLVFTSIWQRITPKYGDRSFRYAAIETGHIAQNIQLTTTALELKCGIAGAFNDQKVASVLRINAELETPLYLLGIGL
jgi:SagB-type dehydrogenase family enzyme